MIDINKLLESKRLEVKITEIKIDKHFVKQFRTNNHLTQVALANILGVTKKTIKKWEQGVNNINGSSAVLLKLLNDNPTLLSQLYSVKVVEGKQEVDDWETNAKKKYTLENYEEFCKEALQVPPVESFEDSSIDEDEWYRQHNIHIVTGNHDIELDYNADNVNEIEYALREMYEVEMDIRDATTGNTITKRVATMRDLVQYYLLDKSYEYSDKEFPKYVKNIFDVNWIKFYESVD